jgi:Zn-dependent protease with chaperone function
VIAGLVLLGVALGGPVGGLNADGVAGGGSGAAAGEDGTTGIVSGAAERDVPATAADWLQEALSAEEAGRPADAATLYGKAVARAPSLVPALEGRCRVERTLGHAKPARDWCARAAAIAPTEANRAAVADAAAIGAPEAAAAALAASARAHPPPGDHSAGWIVRLVGGWLLAGAALAVAGHGLSALTLAAANRLLEADAPARVLDRPLRLAYRAVLAAACAYWYLSLPLVALIVLLLGAGLCVGALALRAIVVGPLVSAVKTSIAVGKSLWARAEPVERDTLDLAVEPGIRGLLGEVAGAVGTRPVDEVVLTPGTDLAVWEEGGVARGRGKRRFLVVGVGVLAGMTRRQFKAVLAHEYGHFSHGDTGGGTFALAARRSLVRLAENLAKAGVAQDTNPMWWFVNGFHGLFFRISHGASRLQELHADRVAARCYGAESFAAGLRHVIARDLAFDAHVDATLREVVDGGRALANLYSWHPTAPLPDLSGRLEELLHRPASALDSHPPPADRMVWVRATGFVGAPPSADDDAPVWASFVDQDALERRMTHRVRERVQERHGVRIAEG